MVWGATAAVLLASTAYSILIPVWRSPDEASHVDLIYQVSETWRYPAWNNTTYTVGVRSRPEVGPFPRPRDEAPSRKVRPSLGDLGGAQPSSVPNHISQHPPLYYALGALGLSVAGAIAPGDPIGDVDMTVGALRLGNAVLVAACPLIAWLVARRAGASKQLATTAALVPLVLPGFVQIGGTVNNDNLLPVTAGLAVLGLVAITRGDYRLRTAAWTGLAIGLALATKATGVFLLAPAAIVIVAVARRRHSWRAGARVAMPMILPIVALAGWWYGPRLARHGKLVPSVLSANRSDGIGTGAGPNLTDDLWQWLTLFVDTTTDTFVGRAGILEAGLPVPLVVATVVALSVLLVAALAGPDKPDALSRTTALLLASPLLVLYLAQAVKSYGSYNPELNRAAVLHGRYLYMAIVPLSVLVARGLRLLCPWLKGWTQVAVITAAAILQTDAAFETLDQFWGSGYGIERGDVDALLAWSAWPAPVTATVFLATGVMFLLLLGIAIVNARTARKTTLDGNWWPRHAMQSARPTS